LPCRCDGRVPDDALARVYDVDSQEVARRRAGAIERLADELGAQRGEDLGAVLQALLDEGTWTAAELQPDGDEGAPDWPVVAADVRRRIGAGARRSRTLPARSRSRSRTRPRPSPPRHRLPTSPRLRWPVVQEPEVKPESSNGQPAGGAGGQRAGARDARRARGHSRAGGRAGRRGSRRKRRVPYLPMLGGFAAAVIGGAAAFVGSSEWGGPGRDRSPPVSRRRRRHQALRPSARRPARGPVPLRAPVDLVLLHPHS